MSYTIQNSTGVNSSEVCVIQLLQALAAHWTSLKICPASTWLQNSALTGTMSRFAIRLQNESSKLPAALVESTVCPPERTSLLVPAPETVSPLGADNVLTRKRIRNNRVSTAKPAGA